MGMTNDHILHLLRTAGIKIKDGKHSKWIEVVEPSLEQWAELTRESLEKIDENTITEDEYNRRLDKINAKTEELEEDYDKNRIIEKEYRKKFSEIKRERGHLNTLLTSKVTIEEYTKRRLDEFDMRKFSPKKYLLKLIERDITKQEEFSLRKLKTEIKSMSDVEDIPILPVLEASKFRYLETNGTNLRDVISMKGVLKRSIKSTNLHEILSTLGVEAMRNAFIENFTKILSLEGAYIDRRHISLLADYVTSMGSFDPVTFKGMVNHQEDVISVASLEKASDYTLDAAAFGAVNPVQSVSSAIAVGAKALIGNYFRDSKMADEDRKKVDELDQVDVDDANVAFDLNIDAADMEIPEGPLKLTIQWGFSSAGSDIDNPVKCFLDCLQKKYGFNDSRIHSLQVDKALVKKGAEYINFDINGII